MKDLTVFRAFCFALRPALITVSESDDMDLSEVTDGDRLCFRDAMIARNVACQLYRFLSMYYIVLPGSSDVELIYPCFGNTG